MHPEMHAFLEHQIYHIRKDAHIFGRVHGFGNNASGVCIRKVFNVGHDVNFDCSGFLSDIVV